MSMHPLTRDPWDELDLFDPGLSSHFEQAVSYLTEQCPVARSADDGYWLVSRYDDVRRLARDWGNFSSSDGIRTYREEGQPNLIPVELDPPEHSMWRHALQPFFTPQAVARYRGGITSAAGELLDRVAGQEVADFAAAFANPFPGVVFFREVLGAPDPDLDMLIDTMHVANFGPVDARPRAWRTIAAYVDDQLRVRRAQAPRADLLQYILDLDLDGQAVEWGDKVNAVSLLISGGLDTTAHVVAGAVWHLATHAEWQDRLRGERTLLPRAVEEYLRLFASGFAIGRVTRSQQTVQGRRIPAGSRVMLGFGPASRDPRVYPNPHTFDIERDSAKHLAFGFGPHHCIGAHLARLELEIALGAVLDRLFEIRPNGSPDFLVGMMRSAASLPIRFTSGGRPADDRVRSGC